MIAALQLAVAVLLSHPAARCGWVQTDARYVTADGRDAVELRCVFAAADFAEQARSASVVAAVVALSRAGT